MTDQEIRNIFRGASDFEVRTLCIGQTTLYGYFVDGLVSGSFVSEYIYRPISQNLPDKIIEAYHRALEGAVYNAVARPCVDLGDVATKLVNGFCVVLFPEVGAIAFEARTGSRNRRILQENL